VKIKVDVSKLTLGDLEDLEAEKISAVVSILERFSDLSRDEVRAIPLADLDEIMDQLAAEVEVQRKEAVPFEMKPD